MKAAASLSCVMVLSLATMDFADAHAQTAPKTQTGAMAEHDHTPAAPSTSLMLGWLLCMALLFFAVS